jgi:peptide/nickel transport system substrate-binding protein
MMKWRRLGAGLLSVALAACATPPSAPAASSTPTGTRAISNGGSLSVALDAEPRSLDPALSGTVQDRQVLINLFSPLFRVEPDGSITPEAVASYQYTNTTTLVLKLRPNGKFHDGEPFDAAAIKWNFERMVNDKTPRAAEISSVKTVEVVTDFEARLNLAAPNAGLLATLADRAGMMVSPKAFARLGANFARQPVGNGPFVFGEWRTNDRIIIKKNTQYFDAQRPYLDELVYRFVPDPDVAVTLLRTKEIDVMPSVPVKNIDALGKEAGITLMQGPVVSYRAISLNNKAEPFTNKACRQAFAAAVDRKTVLAVAFSGKGEVAYGPLTSAFSAYYDSTLRTWDRNVDTAKAKLAECGKPTGYEVTMITITTPTDQQISQLLAQQLGEVGIKINIQLMDFTSAAAKLIAKDFVAFNLGDTGRVDPDGQFFAQFQSKSTANRTNYVNAEVDDLLAQGRATIETASRVPIYRKAQQLIAEDAPMAFIASPQYSAVFGIRDTVAGFAIYPDALMRFRDIGRR